MLGVHQGMQPTRQQRRAADACALSRLRRLNGACDGRLRGGRRRRPNHASERTSSLRSDIVALAPLAGENCGVDPNP
jgi:hypothetical protein